MPGPSYISNSYRPPPHTGFSSLSFSRPQESRLESWSSAALGKLAQAGQWYGKVREDLRSIHSESMHRGLENGKDVGDFLPGKTGQIAAPINKVLDAVMGVGESLEVFAQEHHAGDRRYARTMEKMTRTTGELALTSALGMSAAGAVAAVTGGVALPILAGVGAGIAGYAFARSVFDLTEQKLPWW